MALPAVVNLLDFVPSQNGTSFELPYREDAQGVVRHVNNSGIDLLIHNFYREDGRLRTRVLSRIPEDRPNEYPFSEPGRITFLPNPDRLIPILEKLLRLQAGLVLWTQNWTARHDGIPPTQQQVDGHWQTMDRRIHSVYIHQWQPNDPMEN